MNWMKQFQNPPREYSAVPLWFWNGTLEPDRLRWQIDEMVDKGIYGAFMHARAYLKTPYLEQEWWDAVEACVDAVSYTHLDVYKRQVLRSEPEFY